MYAVRLERPRLLALYHPVLLRASCIEWWGWASSRCGFPLYHYCGRESVSFPGFGGVVCSGWGRCSLYSCFGVLAVRADVGGVCRGLSSRMARGLLSPARGGGGRGWARRPAALSGTMAELAGAFPCRFVLCGFFGVASGCGQLARCCAFCLSCRCLFYPFGAVRAGLHVRSSACLLRGFGRCGFCGWLYESFALAGVVALLWTGGFCFAGEPR